MLSASRVSGGRRGGPGVGGGGRTAGSWGTGFASLGQPRVDIQNADQVREIEQGDIRQRLLQPAPRDGIARRQRRYDKRGDQNGVEKHFLHRTTSWPVAINAERTAQ